MWLPFANVHVYNVVDLVWVLLYGTPPRPHQQAAQKQPAVPSKPTFTLPFGLSGAKRPKAAQTVSTTAPVVASEFKPIIDLQNTPPPLWALVIGINKYKSFDIPPLRGAVPDAEAMVNYLEKDLSVPSAQITNLRDNKATRAAIIKEFRALASNPKIKRGDPILIFYAGHGSTSPAPEGWEAGGKFVQMLVPYDQFCDEDGKKVKVQGLPDRTIGALLNKIAKEKDNNITVIFDCCHSGSGTRIDQVDPTRAERGFSLPNVQISSDIDSDILGSAENHRAMSVAHGFLKHGLRSHVLLAACNEEETAKEEQSRGFFSVALLETLKAVGAHKLTYRDVMQRLNTLPGQNPQCEGHHQDRILFNAKAPSNNRVLYPVRRDGDKYIVEAGAAHGITDGAEFAVYKTRDFQSTAESLGTLKVVMIDPFSTTAEVASGVPFDLGPEAFALQTRAGVEEDLRLHLPLDERLMSVFEALAKEMQERGPAQRKIMLVEEEKKEDADLDITIEDDHIVFNIVSKLVTSYGLKRLPYRIRPTVDEVYPVIRAAAHYYWHLRRTSTEKILQKKVSIEFYKLKPSGEQDDEFEDLLEPDGQNLVLGNVVNLFVEKDAYYGVKIINNSAVDLYPSLFHFDNGDLSIVPYYQPPTSNQVVKAPLRKKDPTGKPGSLTIGYGAGGSVPFSYYLENGQDVDVSFLKLFLSTKQLDLSNVQQNSPFSDEHRQLAIPAQPKPKVAWDTILVTLVQRRAAE